MRSLVLLLVLNAACVGDDLMVNRASQSIVAGQVTDGHASVAVMELRHQGKLVAICTATLVGPRTVLTAAHCMEQLPGDPELDRQLLFWIEGKRTKHAIRRVLIHPEYRNHSAYWHPHRSDLVNDMALLRLESAPAVEPASLNTRPERLALGEPVELVGFGPTSILEIQAKKLKAAKRRAENTIAQVSGTRITLLGAGGICSGDSGGPLLAVGDEPLQVGVASTSVQGTCGDVSRYARVDLYASWIRQASCGEAGFDGSPSTAVSSCSLRCGNGTCEFDESPGICPYDCASFCGNGSCGDGETHKSCAEDCPEEEPLPPMLSLELHPEQADLLVLRRENDVEVSKVYLMVQNQIALEVDDPPKVSEYDISQIHHHRFYVMAVAVTPAGSTGTVLIRLKRGDGGKGDDVLGEVPGEPGGCAIGPSDPPLGSLLMLVLALLALVGLRQRHLVRQCRPSSRLALP